MTKLRRSVLSLVSVAASVAAATAQDAVVQWNDAAVAAIRRAGTPPPPAARNLAILHSAMHDAVNGINPRYRQYLVTPAASAGASAEAAACTAAHDALTAIYPTQSAAFDALHSTMLAGIPNGQAKLDGIAWGAAVARQILAARANDGSANTAPYPGSNDPGKWRPHLSFGGLVRPALLPLWGLVTPFALRSGAQFRPPEPPALRSGQYTFDVLMVQYLGGRDSWMRSREQTQVARFWSYGPNTCTPAGHWNQVASAVARARGESLAENARLFALLNIALADAAIVSWDCKYIVGLWRPITAIQLADQDGNRFTHPDRTWVPLLETPPFPEYTSGHSTFSGAAATILAHFYQRDGVRFTVGSDDLPGVMRSYRSFSEAAWESGLSRIYGGIHFMSANIHGLVTGVLTGEYVWDHVLRPLHP